MSNRISQKLDEWTPFIMYFVILPVAFIFFIWFLIIVAGKDKENAYKRELIVLLNPIKAHKCHDKGLSILLEDSSGSRNWQFVEGFKCRDQKFVEEK